MSYRSATAHLYSQLSPLVLASPPQPPLLTDQKTKKVTKKGKKLKLAKNNKIKKQKAIKNKDETSVNNIKTSSDSTSTNKEERKLIRKAGGQIWEDKTLLDWEEGKIEWNYNNKYAYN